MEKVKQLWATVLAHKKISIAVAVVIVAGIGIVAYNPPDDDDINIDTINKNGMYDVTWQTKTSTVSVDEEMFAGKSSPFTTEIPINHENIVKVTVEVTWTDDNTYGILTTKGQDTLTAEVTCDGKTETWESLKNGTTELNFNINSIPYTTEIQADNEIDALEDLKEQDYTDDSLTLTIDVSVVTGEKLRRPLKYLRDKGNDFDLTISYEYYDAMIGEESFDDTGLENNPDDPEEEQPAYLGMIVNAGMTRW